MDCQGNHREERRGTVAYKKKRWRDAQGRMLKRTPPRDPRGRGSLGKRKQQEVWLGVCGGYGNGLQRERRAGKKVKNGSDGGCTPKKGQASQKVCPNKKSAKKKERSRRDKKKGPKVEGRGRGPSPRNGGTSEALDTGDAGNGLKNHQGGRTVNVRRNRSPRQGRREYRL